MRIVDIHGATNLEIVRGGTNEWYWATDYIHGDLYEAEELFLLISQVSFPLSIFRTLTVSMKALHPAKNY